MANGQKLRQIITYKKVNEISLEVVLSFTSMDALGGSLDVVYIYLQYKLLLDIPKTRIGMEKNCQQQEE
jgi:hypothetical protein